MEKRQEVAPLERGAYYTSWRFTTAPPRRRPFAGLYAPPLGRRRVIGQRPSAYPIEADSVRRRPRRLAIMKWPAGVAVASCRTLGCGKLPSFCARRAAAAALGGRWCRLWRLYLRGGYI